MQYVPPFITRSDLHVRDRDSLAWPPNLLTLARIPLAALVWVAPGSVGLLLACMTIAAVTDWLDGWLARTYPDGAKPGNVGAWLDPLCDKVFVASAAASVLFVAHAPLALVALLMLRELAIVPLVAWYRLAHEQARRFDFRAGLLGKATTVAQFLAIGLLAVASPAAAAACWLAAALGACATLVYVRRAARTD